MPTRIYLSHADEDKGIADELKEYLEAEQSIEIISNEILAGSHLNTTIAKHLEQSEFVICLLSDCYFTGKHNQKIVLEKAKKITTKEATRNNFLIPVCIDDFDVNKLEDSFFEDVEPIKIYSDKPASIKECAKKIMGSVSDIKKTRLENQKLLFEKYSSRIGKLQRR